MHSTGLSLFFVTLLSFLPFLAVAAPALAVDSALVPATSPAKRGAAYSGDMTYYFANGLGSCGEDLTGKTGLVALSIHIQGVPAAHCGKKITINIPGKEPIEARVVDTCMGCALGDIDVDKATFERIWGGLDLGRVSGVAWTLN